MFYLKCGRRVRRTIRSDNVYCRCPDCGKEQTVDLFEVFRAGGDLCTTGVYCPECAAKRAAEKKPS